MELNFIHLQVTTNVFSFMNNFFRHFSFFQAPDEKSLHDLESELKEANIDHKIWIEKPENIPTCLVAKPYPKEKIQKYFKKYKLFKH